MTPSALLPASNPVEAVAGIAKTLAALAKVAPAINKHVGGNQRDRQERRALYTHFLRAATELSGAATHLLVLARSQPTERGRHTKAAVAMAPALAGFAPFLREFASGVAPAALLALASDFTADAQYRHACYRSVENARDAVERFTAAFHELRLIGGPAPQRQADSITVLLEELLSLLTSTDEHVDRCVSATNEHIALFVPAAQEDLLRRRWHLSSRERGHGWQFWRKPALAHRNWDVPSARELLGSEAAP